MAIHRAAAALRRDYLSVQLQRHQSTRISGSQLVQEPELHASLGVAQAALALDAGVPGTARVAVVVRSVEEALRFTEVHGDETHGDAAGHKMRLIFNALAILLAWIMVAAMKTAKTVKINTCMSRDA